jgi:preprotein translocase subunit SecG
MGIAFNLVLTVHILVGLAVIGLVLLQHGKGADMGAAFGSGASGSLFGASGSANFLSRATAVLATIFFCTSLALSYLATSTQVKSRSVMDGAAQVVPAAAPESLPADSKAKDIPK